MRWQKLVKFDFRTANLTPAVSNRRTKELPTSGKQETTVNVNFKFVFKITIFALSCMIYLIMQCNLCV